MFDVIHSDTRGAVDHGWLKAKHTFSFGDYHNPAMMGFGPLRVINEDRIEPSQGFGTHPHKDMEIVTYIIQGALAHKDSMGNGSVIEAGDVQRMTAGTGVFHSEFNQSEEDAVHLLQIWILPRESSLQPGYEQQHFDREDKLNQWRLVASSDGRESSMTVHQAVDLYASILEAGNELQHEFSAGHSGYLQIVSGSVTANDELLEAGDAVAIRELELLTVLATSNAEMILFDMA
ncbi:MAG: pirin family protein [Gammaproteobacteria bacterium]|nr:pirin family protein [Gammaproteobacteria bacterium]MDH3416622.1 pirin family protein [Gammaproteobacteria bacterium]